MPGRSSRVTLEVLAYFLEHRDEDAYGFEIIKNAGIKSGTLYPILDRLEDNGWLEARWETIDPAAEKRPRRRNYRLTGAGVAAASAELEAATRALIRPSFRTQPSAGW